MLFYFGNGVYNFVIIWSRVIFYFTYRCVVFLIRYSICPVLVRYLNPCNHYGFKHYCILLFDINRCSLLKSINCNIVTTWFLVIFLCFLLCCIIRYGIVYLYWTIVDFNYIHLCRWLLSLLCCFFFLKTISLAQVTPTAVNLNIQWCNTYVSSNPMVGYLRQPLYIFFKYI